MTKKEKYNKAIADAVKLYARIQELESPEVNDLKRQYHDALETAVKLQCGIDDG